MNVPSCTENHRLMWQSVCKIFLPIHNTASYNLIGTVILKAPPGYPLTAVARNGKHNVFAEK